MNGEYYSDDPEEQMAVELGEAWIMLSHLRDVWKDCPREIRCSTMRVILGSLERALEIAGSRLN